MARNPFDQGRAYYHEQSRKFEAMARRLGDSAVAVRFRKLASEARERAARSEVE